LHNRAKCSHRLSERTKRSTIEQNVVTDYKRIEQTMVSERAKERNRLKYDHRWSEWCSVYSKNVLNINKFVKFMSLLLYAYRFRIVMIRLPTG
jgi:hypothetical protein